MFYPQSCTSWSTASSEYLGKKLIRCKMIQSVNEWTEPRSSGRLVALIQKFVINIQLNIVTQDDTLTCCSWRLWLVRQEDCKGAKGRHKTANTSVDAPSDYPINRASLQKIGVYLQVQCWSLLSNPGSPLYIAKNAMSQKSMWMGTKHNLDACVIAFSQTIKGLVANDCAHCSERIHVWTLKLRVPTTSQLPWYLDVVSYPETKENLKWFRFHIFNVAASSNHLGCYGTDLAGNYCWRISAYTPAFRTTIPLSWIAQLGFHLCTLHTPITTSLPYIWKKKKRNECTTFKFSYSFG